MMEAGLAALLAELESWGRANDERESDRARKMLNLDPASAKLISILLRAAKRTRLLEIGTSNGYSTIWLAWSARTTDGRVWSIDRDASKHALADANLRRAGLRERVELITGDATRAVADLVGPFDFVFLDADRHSAPAQVKLLLPKLTANALVIADNVLSHPGEMAGYVAMIECLPQFEHMVLPVGKGLSLAYRAEG